MVHQTNQDGYHNHSFFTDTKSQNVISVINVTFHCFCLSWYLHRTKRRSLQRCVELLREPNIDQSGSSSNIGQVKHKQRILLRKNLHACNSFSLAVYAIVVFQVRGSHICYFYLGWHYRMCCGNDPNPFLYLLNRPVLNIFHSKNKLNDCYPVHIIYYRVWLSSYCKVM